MSKKTDTLDPKQEFLTKAHTQISMWIRLNMIEQTAEERAWFLDHSLEWMSDMYDDCYSQIAD